MKVLVTCPPMLGMKEQFIPLMEKKGLTAVCPNVTQTMTVEELMEIVPECDGWIIGDDPATAEVFRAGYNGKLKAAVKWGIGVDNVDFSACESLGIPIINTPNMFGAEVADVGVGYLLALARQTYPIDRGIRNDEWPKNRGMSLDGKTVGLVGYGDIGKQTAARLKSFGLKIIVFDPGVKDSDVLEGCKEDWPEKIQECDFLLFTCSLNAKNYHMLSESELSSCKDGVRIINVARGPLIDEPALVEALISSKVHSVALDVFEIEPLPANSFLRRHELSILGSHNGSNTEEAVIRTNIQAIDKVAGFLKNYV